MLALYVLDYYMKSLKVAKVLSEAVNRRTDNTSVNRTNNDLEHITQERSRNRNPTKNREWTRVPRNCKHFLFFWWTCSAWHFYSAMHYFVLHWLQISRGWGCEYETCVRILSLNTCDALFSLDIAFLSFWYYSILYIFIYHRTAIKRNDSKKLFDTFFW
jgi:hypothetical protein